MKRSLTIMLSTMLAITTSVIRASGPEVKIQDISQTVVMMSLAEGVSIEDATNAMTSKAAELNLKLVGRQFVHKEMHARGKEANHLEILQFCDPEDAIEMVKKDPLYSAYMPCRISVVEDSNHETWLFMLNLDMLINSNALSPDLQAIAIRVNQAMLAIMTAGATGEF